MSSADVLSALKARKDAVRVGLVGAGAMGKGILYQTLLTPNVTCVALCDIKVDQAVACARELRIDHQIVDSASAMEEAIRAGRLAICEDGMLVARCEQVDVFVESTSSISAGANFTVAAIESGKHVNLMNAEIDLVFGPYFLQLARRHGVTYTSCDGDQHTVLKNVIDDMTLWGFELVMAGNIKGFLDRTADPIRIKPEAEKRRLDYKMCTAYTDGTKLCIEMALIANALGLKTTKPGMTGPQAKHVDEVLGLFDFDALWEKRQPVVDYVLGALPGGGVYAVGYQDHPFQSFMLNYYKMGPGPFYLFYRPYHLCHVESIASIVRPALDGFSLLQPDHGFRTDVFAYAKKDLRAGEMLDGIGGHTCYGLIENVNNKVHGGLEICLAEHLPLKRDIKANRPIMLSDVDIDAERDDFRLRTLALRAVGALDQTTAIAAE